MGRKKPGRKAEPPSKRRIAWPRWTGLRGKTVWDWLQLLIVPFMLAAFGFWFTAQQDARQQEIEERRAQDLALQGYLDQMSTLVLEDLDDPKVRTMLQARTLTVLRRLDSSRKTEVMRYLVDAELVHRVDGSDPIIGLSGVNLSGIDLHGGELSGAYLFSADLSEAYLSGADLNNAYLIGADLSGANLSGADLSEARLNGADLNNADLSGARLNGADLNNADLSEANLSDAWLDNADLSYADLSGADLTVANLSGANLSGAYKLDSDGSRRIVTNEEVVEQAGLLEGATMPDGQKYEDWLKSKERG